MRSILRAAVVTTVPLSLLGTGCGIEDFYRSKDHPDNKVVSLEARLSGAKEVPPADPNGTGSVLFSLSTYDDALCFDLRVEKLAPVTEAHVHQGPAGVNGPIVVDLGVRATVPDWCKSKDRVSVLKAGDGAPGNEFGRFLALDNGTAIVAADEAAYVFVFRDGVWLEQQKLTAPSPGFGSAVALSGNTAAVSAAEVVHVFVRSYDVWSIQQTLTMPDSGSFGTAVALSGETLLVGAPSFAGEGAVFVFDRAGTFWSETARLMSELPAPGAFGCFGCSLALSGDLALVGAPSGPSPAENTGLAVVFERSAATWKRVPLTRGDSPNSQLGDAVALFGTTALVGAPGNFVFDKSSAVGQGTAEVFERKDGTWAQQLMAKNAQNASRTPLDALTASDAAFNTDFGSTVAVTTDLAIVGAPRANAAYTFTRSGELWHQADKLMPGKGQPAIGYGTAVAAAGKTVLIGAPGDGVTQGLVFAEDVSPPLCEIPKQNFNGCVGIERGLLNAIADHPASYYANVHTSKFPEGAIRGQLEDPDAVSVVPSSQ